MQTGRRPKTVSGRSGYKKAWYRSYLITRLSKNHPEIGRFKTLLKAARDGDVLAGTHYDLGVGIIVNMMNINNIAAMTLEEAIV